MLFEPISFSGLNLTTRLVRSATYEKRADEDGFVTESLIKLYEELAIGGSGLLVTGIALVHPSGRILPQMLSVHSQRYVERLRELTTHVHALGGLIALQVAHGGRQSPPVFLGGDYPMAPSAVTDPSSGVTPRAMTDEQIWQMVDAFGDAAGRAREANFDAVQIHAAHGYLVSSFVSPHTNRRDDYWGGDEERRFHFLEELCKAMRKSAGGDYPILIKMNADDLLPPSAERPFGGLEPPESLRIAQRLESLGIDAIEISGGMRESPVKTIRPDILSEPDEAYFRDAGALFKRHLRVPVIVTGGMRSRAVMEAVLQGGEADLIGLSRPLIREPALPNLMKAGKPKADCVSCSKCANFLKHDSVTCLAVLNE